MSNFYTIQATDVGKHTITAFGKRWSVEDFLGNVQKDDVGKRVYKVRTNAGDSYILQVENSGQFRERLRKERMTGLNTAIATQKQATFINPEKHTDEDALGVLIANWAEWDGERIVQAFLSALEDANFHTFRGVIAAEWEKEETT